MSSAITKKKITQKPESISTCHSKTNICRAYGPYLPASIPSTFTPFTTARLFVYGNAMRCVSEDNSMIASAKYLGKGKTEKLMCMYINDSGEPVVSDILSSSIIFGEVYEVDDDKINRLRSIEDGRTLGSIWVKMQDNGGETSRQCWIPLYNEITKHYLQNEAEIIKSGDWFAAKNENMRRLLSGVSLDV